MGKVENGVERKRGTHTGTDGQRDAKGQEDKRTRCIKIKRTET